MRRSPGYDLRGLLGGADTSLRGAIDLSEPSRGRGRMLAGGVETVWMDPLIRTKVSRALQAAQAAAPSALYALWLCGEKLVSLAQPKEPSHRLDSRDLLLLVNFVATQPALRNAESWTPVCFPRFQEKVSDGRTDGRGRRQLFSALDWHEGRRIGVISASHTRRFAPRAAYAARYACSGRKNSVKRTKKGPCLIVSTNWRLENAKNPAAILQKNNPQRPHE